MTGIMEQRLREAVKAELAGRAVHFEIQEGGAGQQLVAMYRVTDYVRSSRHVIFTGGSGARFGQLARECREWFSETVSDAMRGKECA